MGAMQSTKGPTSEHEAAASIRDPIGWRLAGDQ